MKKRLLTIIVFNFCLMFYSSGQITFQKTFGGTGDDEANAIDLTNDNGYIIGGYTTHNFNGDWDACIIKLDSLGTLQWTKHFGDVHDDYVSDIHQTFDGGYITCGIADYDGQGNESFFLHQAKCNWEYTMDEKN